MAKIGKIIGGTAKVALAGSRFAMRIGMRAAAGPLGKLVIPDLRYKNIVKECEGWFRDGIQDIKEGLSDNA